MQNCISGLTNNSAKITKDLKVKKLHKGLTNNSAKYIIVEKILVKKQDWKGFQPDGCLKNRSMYTKEP